MSPSTRATRSAASRRCASAMLALAEMMSPATERAAGVQKNARAALRWLYRARAAGEHRADVLLGFSLFHGIGVESSAEEGLRRLHAAAEKGWGTAVIRIIQSMEMIGPRKAEHEALCRLCQVAERRLKRLRPHERMRERQALQRYASELFQAGRRGSGVQPGASDGTKHWRLLRYAAALGHGPAARLCQNTERGSG